MIKNILHTIGSKFLLAISNLITIVVITKVLGTDGRGEVSLFVTNMTFILHLCYVVGGTAVTYLTPRKNFYQLLAPSYLWSILATLIGVGLFYLFGKLQDRFFIHIIIITIINAWNGTNLTVLLGKERITTHNILAVIQPIILLIYIVVSYFLLEELTVFSYLYALYISLLCTFIISWFYLNQFEDRFSIRNFKSSLKSLFRYGLVAQLANLLQLFNYRITYYFISTDEKLGILSNAVAIAESLWILGKAMATVQYSRIVNTEDQSKNALITIRFFKLSFGLTLIASLILLIIPPGLFVFLFNRDFSSLPLLFPFLVPGIIFLGTSATLSPYFSGQGRYEQSLIASLLGGIGAILGCIYLIPELGNIGACITMSISYFIGFIYLWSRFQYEQKLNWKLYIPSLIDFKELKKIVLKTD